jgi:hypothetical protein
VKGAEQSSLGCLTVGPGLQWIVDRGPQTCSGQSTKLGLLPRHFGRIRCSECPAFLHDGHNPSYLRHGSGIAVKLGISSVLVVIVMHRANCASDNRTYVNYGYNHGIELQMLIVTREMVRRIMQ